MSTSAPPTAAGRRRTRRIALPPRRISGPLRPAPAGARAGGGGAAAAPATRPGIALPAPGRVLEGLRGLPDHRFTDRLVGGRAWIPVVGMLLIGIVTMQVGLLRLNSGIGRSVERAAVLERENAALRAVNGRLSSGERVREAALRAGLVDPLAGSVRFLRGGADARSAVRAIKPPGRGPAATAAAAAATPTTTGVATATPTATTLSTPTVTTPPSLATPPATATIPATPPTTSPSPGASTPTTTP